MSATARPYGLRYWGLPSGKGAGAANEYTIASGYGTAIGIGDVVKRASDGTIVKDTGTTAATPLGVLDHVEYLDANGEPKFGHWPASTVATEIRAFVYSDPDAVFMIQADEALDQTDVGNNAALVQGAVNSFGHSTVALDGSTAATTNTLPVRILKFAPMSDTVVGSGYPDVLVSWVAGMHQDRAATGV